MKRHMVRRHWTIDQLGDLLRIDLGLILRDRTCYCVLPSPISLSTIYRQSYFIKSGRIHVLFEGLGPCSVSMGAVPLRRTSSAESNELRTPKRLHGSHLSGEQIETRAASALFVAAKHEASDLQNGSGTASRDGRCCEGKVGVCQKEELDPRSIAFDASHRSINAPAALLFFAIRAQLKI